MIRWLLTKTALYPIVEPLFKFSQGQESQPRERSNPHHTHCRLTLARLNSPNITYKTALLTFPNKQLSS
jgi:hypothetical protein